MLAELSVSNLVVVEKARLELCRGLNAFTGETGAGKSLLVDALALLFGGRSDPGLVRPGADQAEVAARFMLSDAEVVHALQDSLGVVFDDESQQSAGGSQTGNTHELVVSRLFPRKGRARAYANGRPIAQAALRELGGHLVDLHGQNENQSLLRPATRTEILDRFASATKEREAYRKAWVAARAAAERLSELRRAARDRSGREEFVRFQVRELEAARLDETHAEKVHEELGLLRNAESIRAVASIAAEQLDGEDGLSAAALLARALRDLDGLKEPPPAASEVAERLHGQLEELRDAARELVDLAERARSDPERLAELEEQRAAIQALERKHGRDVAGLIELRDELRLKLADLSDLDVCTEEAERALASAIQTVNRTASALTRKRKAGARDLERQVRDELADLELKGSGLQTALTPHEARTGTSGEGGDALGLLPPRLRASGAEQFELLFSANPEQPVRPLAECVSGGELSRVMLAIKGVLARAGGADRLPVVVFDEIDSGVGGRLGAVLGRKLGGLAQVRQVLCVTHLPQLAAYAQRQIKVEKTRRGEATSVSVTVVEGKTRVEELSLMLRGESANKHTREEAAEMLRAAQAEVTAKVKRRTGRKKTS